MKKLVINSIEKSFEFKKILSNIHIECEKGKIVGLLGRNGSGKSTLFNIIIGADSSDYKYINADGVILKNQNLRSKYIHLLPQKGLLPNNIKMSTAVKYYCNKESINTLKKDPILVKYWDEYARELSGGELKYIETLIIIYSTSHYALLDEPFNALSPMNRDSILEHIQHKSREGKGFIISDHDYESIITISNSLYFLHQGNTIAISSKKDLVDWGYIRG